MSWGDLMRTFMARCALIALPGLMSSCTSLPSLEEATGGIPVSDIVARVKCELSDAFTGDQDIDNKDMNWMKSWVAQSDLTLEILDSSTIAPGGSWTRTFHNAYNTAAGPSSISTLGVLGTAISSIPQSFALTLGASLNGQSSRTETLSFAVSLEELKRWRAQPDALQLCAASDGTDLAGRLGLKEWIAQAVQPVHGRLLFAGYHPKPQSTPQVSPKPSEKTTPPTPAAYKSLEFNLQAVKETPKCDPNDVQVIKVANDIATTARTTLLDQKLVGLQTYVETSANAALSDFNSESADFKKSLASMIDRNKGNKDFLPVLDPYLTEEMNNDDRIIKRLKEDQTQLQLYIKDNVTKAKTSAQDAATFQLNAQNAIQGLLKEIPNPLPKEGDQCPDKVNIATILSNAKSAEADAQGAVKLAATALNDVQSAAKNSQEMQKVAQAISQVSGLPPLDPPISTIGQSIQFVLVTSGNVTPTWTFAVVKEFNSPFLSGTATKTHMLNITLGPTTAPPSGSNLAIGNNNLYMLLNNRLPSLAQ